MSNQDNFVYDVIERLRGRLLDLSARNTLISFRHSERSRRQLRIIDTFIDSTFKYFEDGGGIQVESLPLPKSEPEDEQTAEFLNELEYARRSDETYIAEIEKLGPDHPVKAVMKLESELRDRVRISLGMSVIVREKVISKTEHAKQLGIDPSFELASSHGDLDDHKESFQTLLYPEEMERKLSSIYGQAKLSESEAGINTLFCALGFLEWYESDHSNEPIYSPILLYPIQITRELCKGEYVFEVGSRDEDLAENICLQERLRRDFGFQPFSLDEEETPESYLNRLDKLVQKYPTWKVHRQITIGFFTFSKLVMYHDLAREKLGHLGDDSIINTLIEGSDDQDKAFAEEYNVDEPKIQNKIKTLITDADSSQASALVDIAKGKNVVIEGPPGTGKSQTITNIIASAISDGKSVLFIAEKRAALEVVKKRLDSSHLGDFCIELHSNKTRKTDVLKSLDDRLKHRRLLISSGKNESLVSERKSIMETIWKYVNIMNGNIGEIGMTLHSVVWRYLRLSEEHSEFPNWLQDVVLESPDVVTESKLENSKLLLNRLEDLYQANIGEFDLLCNHPWHGIAHYSHSSEDIRSVVTLVGAALEKLKGLETVAKKLPILGMHVCNISINEMQVLYGTLLKAVPLLEKDIDADIVPALEKLHTNRSVRQILIYHKEVQRINDLLSSFFHNGNVSNKLSLDGVVKIASDAARNGISRSTVAELPDKIQDAVREKELWKELFTFLTTVRNKLGIDEKLTLRNSLLLLHSVSVVSKTSIQNMKYRRPGILDPENRDILESKHKIAQEIRKGRSSLREIFNLDREVPVTELEKAADTLERSSFWSILSSEHRNAKKLFKRLYVKQNKVTARMMAKSLFELSRINRDIESFSSDTKLRNIVMDLFDDIDTPFEPIIGVNLWGQEVINVLPSFSDLSLKLRSVLFNATGELLIDLRSMGDHPNYENFMIVVSQLQDSPMREIEQQIKDIEGRLDCLMKINESSKFLEINPNIVFEDLSNVSELLEKRVKLENRINSDESLTEILGKPYTHYAAELELVESTLDYIDNIKNLQLPDYVSHKILQTDGRRHLSEIIDESKVLGDYLPEIESVMLRVDYFSGGKNEKAAGDNNVHLKTKLPSLIGVFASAFENHDKLTGLVEYLSEEWYVRSEGLSPILDKYDKSGRKYEMLSSAYEYCVYSSLLKQARARFPEFFRHSIGFHYEELRKRFRTVDKQILEEEAKELFDSLMDREISWGIGRGRPRDLTELGLINYEISKERKHVPIRYLMSNAGTAIKQMKPCFMMSPLSVAQFLPHGSIEFDMVVMDEASQLRPEEALGAVIRARQAVIVGDPKQLPPTNFFNFSAEQFLSDDDDPDLDCDQESILDLAMKSFQAVRRLKWHYRSKHESLIAFSNNEFYDNDLIVFPSSCHSNKECGITFIPVNGTYDKRRNRIEAEAVVNEAVKHMTANPKKSIGIVTMNQEQRDLITELIDNKTKSDPVVQSYRAEWDNTLEPLFVKNLENVQGDERDAIFVSTVYGKDVNGNFYQRFGPINGSAGHRRLNVLFTRAKYKMNVFSSIDPDMILIDNRSSRGLRAFKGFLHYAKTGFLSTSLPVRSGRDPDSDFEVFVMRKLVKEGYCVEPQVGVAGYFIDLGVKDPSFLDKYALGIECDGATFHSAKSARDRDKIRHEILVKLGWKIHHIWSTDWFSNPDREFKRLLSLLPPLY